MLVMRPMLLGLLMVFLVIVSLRLVVAGLGLLLAVVLGVIVSLGLAVTVAMALLGRFAGRRAGRPRQHKCAGAQPRQNDGDDGNELLLADAPSLAL